MSQDWNEIYLFWAENWERGLKATSWNGDLTTTNFTRRTQINPEIIFQKSLFDEGKLCYFFLIFVKKTKIF